MAIDTRDKRSSASDASLPWRGLLPLPDGSLDQGDRQHAADMYSGILASVVVLWTDVSASADTWTDVTADSGVWTDVAASSDTWTDTTDDTSTWTDVTPSTDTWTDS